MGSHEGEHAVTRRGFLTAATVAGTGVMVGGLADSAGAAPGVQAGGAAAGIKTGSVQANGLEFHYLEMGQGPLALCLHGFPDSAWTYRHLLPALAAAGYRAVAVFMRGYAPTQVPASGGFHTRDLAQDAVSLHRALGGDSNAVLIGHDWGAVAAYGGAQLDPTRWRRCVIINVPPLAVYSQIAFGYSQVKLSFYFWFFQMEVSNQVVPANDLAFINGLWADWSPGYDASDDLPRAKDCIRNPANFQAAMGYYRTFFDPDTFGTPAFIAEQTAIWGKPLTQRCLYLHGKRDGCIALDATAAAGVAPFLGPGSQVELVDGVGHFLLVEKPREINARIVRFLKS